MRNSKLECRLLRQVAVVWFTDEERRSIRNLAKRRPRISSEFQRLRQRKRSLISVLSGHDSMGNIVHPHVNSSGIQMLYVTVAIADD